MSFNFMIMGSGSSGNSYLIWDEEGKILVDVGLAAKTTEERCNEQGATLEGLNAIIVSHEHTDHCKGLGTVSRRYDAPVRVNYKTRQKLPKDLGDYKKVLFTPLKPFQEGGFKILSFELPHDSADCVGFRISKDGSSVTIVTDLGYIPPNLSKRLSTTDIIVLEFNYDEHMLDTGPYPAFLKRRVKGPGHLDNVDAMDLLAESLHKSKKDPIAFCAHLSEENNEPDLVAELVDNRMEEEGLDNQVLVAARHSPSDIYEI